VKKDLLYKKQIDLVMDVGANTGQFSRHLRDIGYRGRIMSFEPLINEFIELKLNSERDSSWDVYNFAFGNEDKDISINVAGNSYSSSFLEMNKRHIESAPHSKYVGMQKVKMKKLDTFFTEMPELSKYNIFLKLDVQGFEKNVILGAEKVLNMIQAIQLELSFEELYKGETLFFDMVEFLKQKQYYISLVTPEFTSPDNDKLLQVDTIFLRD
jgi:FkbM family methyltransferase